MALVRSLRCTTWRPVDATQLLACLHVTMKLEVKHVIFAA